MTQSGALSNRLAVGTRIRDARNASGMTVEAVARELGTSSRTVAGWQSGRSRPSYEKLAHLAALFGRPISYFLEPDGATTGEEAAAPPAPGDGLPTEEVITS